MKFTASEKRLEHEDLHKGSDKGQACFKGNLNLRNHQALVWKRDSHVVEILDRVVLTNRV